MIFETTPVPRVFATEPGADFAQELVGGLRERFVNYPPEAIGSAEIIVNTSGNLRRIRRIFIENGPGFVPRLKLVTDIAEDMRLPDIPDTASWLRIRLEMSRAVALLLQKDERFGAQETAFDLACSLADLLDEMHGENVDPERLTNLDISDHSGHWQRSLEFIDIMKNYWRSEALPSREARQRLAVEALLSHWKSHPPDHPVIVAGSTGSRGATQQLMCDVACLQQGAVILPCFDFDMPEPVWDRLEAADGGEEHPQYRFKAFLDHLGATAGEVRPWRRQTRSNNPARRKLLSLALRPAPVTDQWMVEGPLLRDLDCATAKMALLEAPNPRMEAVAIAVALRQAVHLRQQAALATPDSRLARQVKAALLRWDLVPFDSRGERLTHTPPGIMILQVAAILGKRPDPLTLCALLKHPLVHSGQQTGSHRRYCYRLERYLRRHGPISDPLAHMRKLAACPDTDKDYRSWLAWLEDILLSLADHDDGPLDSIASCHYRAIEHLAAGPMAKGSGRLWDKEAGRVAHEFFEEFRRDTNSSEQTRLSDYRSMFASAASRCTVFETVLSRQDIAIWSTLDARMQRPDLLIAGGLNSGVWPALPEHDSWLNRDLRAQVGLLMPERRTGLSAHDFLQSVSIEHVVLTRCLRDDSGPTVPSRWISRLTGLLEGIGSSGTEALDAMRSRGQKLLGLAQQMEQPTEQAEPARRPAPVPPAAERPKKMAVTEVRTLITDPYAVYAKRILKLRPASPLRSIQFAALRGTLVHRIFENFASQTGKDLGNDPLAILLNLAEREFCEADIEERFRRLWRADLESLADDFIRAEFLRRKHGSPLVLEAQGSILVPQTDFRIVAKADRIDKAADGSVLLYDYKTGTVPTDRSIDRYELQLPLMAAMIERGAFDGLGDCPRVSWASYIKVGRQHSEQRVKRYKDENSRDRFEQSWQRVYELVRYFISGNSTYISRRAAAHLSYEGDYDHLARYGEWNDADQPERIDLA